MSKALYTLSLEGEQMERLAELLEARDWVFASVDHSLFAYRDPISKVNVVGYKSGKLVVQGKGTEAFVRDVLEAEITGDPRLGYDEVHHPEWFEDHAGIDESGKGDLFGPLVSATVVAEEKHVRDWMDKGIQDSKRITSDARIVELEKVIRQSKGVAVEVVFAGMRKYNELYQRFGNVNQLLAWMHGKSLSQALDAKPVAWGMLDQFTKQKIVHPYVKDRKFELRMETKAESDPVVAAASIVARATFIRQMKKLSDEAGETLLRGASAQTLEQARKLVERLGPERLGDFAKLHFRTAQEALGKTPPPRQPWRGRRSG